MHLLNGLYYLLATVSTIIVPFVSIVSECVHCVLQSKRTKSIREAHPWSCGSLVQTARGTKFVLRIFCGGSCILSYKLHTAFWHMFCWSAFVVLLSLVYSFNFMWFQAGVLKILVTVLIILLTYLNFVSLFLFFFSMLLVLLSVAFCQFWICCCGLCNYLYYSFWFGGYDCMLLLSITHSYAVVYCLPGSRWYSWSYIFFHWSEELKLK